MKAPALDPAAAWDRWADRSLGDWTEEQIDAVPGLARSPVLIAVVGTPAPKGSARAIRRGARAVLVASSSNANRAGQKAWAAAVGWAAKVRCATPIAGPIAVTLVFALARPASVKRARPSVKPDIDKLARATLDALTGIAWIDDAQVVRMLAEKRYATPGCEPGAFITIEPLPDPDPKPENVPAKPARSAKP